MKQEPTKKYRNLSAHKFVFDWLRRKLTIKKKDTQASNDLNQ